MKQVRFTSVVEQSGKPEVYLLFSDPKDDFHFQKALKANRVMTLHRGGAAKEEGVGGKTDFGTMGFAPGPHAQVLLFPRALKIAVDARVVGINYTLLDEEHEPVKEQKETKEKIKARPKPKPNPPPAKSEDPKPPPVKPEPPPKPKIVAKPLASLPPKPSAPEKVIPFPKSAKKGEPGNEVKKLKAEIRKALKALEAGKDVAAFQMLKKIVEEHP